MLFSHRGSVVIGVVLTVLSASPVAGAVADAGPVSLSAAAHSDSALVGKQSKRGTLKIVVSGSGSYTVTGKKYRKSGRTSTSFRVKPGRYTVKAPTGSVKPGTVKVRKGKVSQVKVTFPATVTPTPTPTGGAPVTGTPPPTPTPTPTPPAGPLLAPTGVTATAGNQSALVSWSPVAGAARYAVYQSTSPDGPWTPVGGSPNGTSVGVSGLVNTTEYWFRVAGVDASSAEGAFSIPASAVPDVVPPPPSVTTTISPTDSTVVNAGDFTATIPAGTVDVPGVPVTVTPLAQGEDGLPGVDVHIHGSWDPGAGGVNVAGPWSFADTPDLAPVVFHEHGGQTEMFTGPQVTVAGDRAAVTLDSLSNTFWGANLCTPGTADTVLCSNSALNGDMWRQYAKANAQKAKEALIEKSPCGDRVFPATSPMRTARTWGANPFGIACSLDANSDGSASWSFRNDNHGSVLVASTEVLYVHNEHGGRWNRTRVEDPDAPEIRKALAGVISAWAIAPGDAMVLTKAPNSGETEVNIHVDLAATTAWHGAGDAISLAISMLPAGEVYKVIADCGREAAGVIGSGTTMGHDGAVALINCAKSATATLVKNKANTATGSLKARLGTVSKALAALNVGQYFTDWAFANAALTDHVQTLRNYDPVSAPTDRGGTDYIARDPSNGRSVWVKNGTSYNIPDGEEYLCLAQSRIVWDIGGLVPLDTRPEGWPASGCTNASRELWTYTPTAQGGNTGTGIILRNTSGNAWLINNAGEIQTIEDGAEYRCLARTNPVLWNTPQDKIDAWSDVADSPTGCLPRAGLMAGDADNFGYGDAPVPCEFYDRSQSGDLGIFDRELVDRFEVDTWMHDFRNVMPPGFRPVRVTLQISEIFSDQDTSSVTFDGVERKLVGSGTPTKCGPSALREFVLEGPDAAVADDGEIEVVFRENDDDIALDFSNVVVEGADGRTLGALRSS